MFPDRLKTSEELISQSSSTFFERTMPSFSNIKQHILRRFAEKAYDQLKEDLHIYGLTTKVLDQFFRKEGRMLLSNSVVFDSDVKELAFLIENIPNAAIKEVLSNSNFDILQNFLSVEILEEKYNRDTFEIRELRINKFQLLMKIDSEGVEKFMSVPHEDCTITAKIAEDFRKAKETVNQKLELEKPQQALGPSPSVSAMKKM